MKKGQFEIIGLAVIVIVITVAGLFFLLVDNETQEDPLENFRDTQYAQNLLDSILKTDLIECPGTWSDYLYWMGEGITPRRNIVDTVCADPFSDSSLQPYETGGALPRGVTLLSDMLEASFVYSGHDYFFQFRTPQTGGNCFVRDARDAAGCDPVITLYSTEPDGTSNCDPDEQFTNKPGEAFVVLSSAGDTGHAILFLCNLN